MFELHRRNGFHAGSGTGVGQGAVQRRLRSPGSTEFRCLLPQDTAHPVRLLGAGNSTAHWQLWQAALFIDFIVNAPWCHVLAAGMRRIDLTCLIAAPIAVGFVMTYGGSRAAVAVRSAAWYLRSNS